MEGSLYAIDNLASYLKSGEQMSKAFDKVTPPCMQRLTYYNTYLHVWIKDFLTDRSQRVTEFQIINQSISIHACAYELSLQNLHVFLKSIAMLMVTWYIVIG